MIRTTRDLPVSFFQLDFESLLYASLLNYHYQEKLLSLLQKWIKYSGLWSTQPSIVLFLPRPYKLFTKGTAFSTKENQYQLGKNVFTWIIEIPEAMLCWPRCWVAEMKRIDSSRCQMNRSGSLLPQSKICFFFPEDSIRSFININAKCLHIYSRGSTVSSIGALKDWFG